MACEPAVFVYRAWSVVISKHLDDGFVTGLPEKVEEVLRAVGRRFLLKIEPELQTGQETMYVGQALTKIEGGFALRPSAKLINNLSKTLNLTKASDVSTPCIKQEMRRESEKEFDFGGGVVGTEGGRHLAVHRP